MNSPDRYAPPQAKVVDIVEDSDDFELAGAGARLDAHLIDTMIDSLLIFSDSRQSVHDEIADTIVVVA